MHVAVNQTDFGDGQSKSLPSWDIKEPPIFFYIYVINVIAYQFFIDSLSLFCFVTQNLCYVKQLKIYCRTIIEIK